MENQSTSIESLWDRVRDYIETRTELLKLKAIDKAAGIVSGMVTKIILVIIFFIFISLVNLGIAIWLGTLLGELYYGFFALAGFYAITGLVLYLGRKKWIKDPISNSMIKNLMD